MPQFEDQQLTRRVVARYLIARAPERNSPETIETWLEHNIGIAKGLARRIADAVYRGRNLLALAVQQGWPVENDKLVGAKDEISLYALATFRTAPLPVM